MSIKNNLAIVIPAYKSTFLRATLDSIANQSCKDFTLYVGDDASPNDIFSIVKNYNAKIDLVYHRFETNLGGTDLAAQWERCIDLVQDEEWVWLFSDDDVMSNNCVELFYNTVNSSSVDYLFHFNIDMIDEKGKVEKIFRSYPDLISSKDFFSLISASQISSFAVEYIFSRVNYRKWGGFQNFDLAWGSDHATWIKLSFDHGIKTMQEGRVSWRKSSENISPNRSDIKQSIRKVKASSMYYSWAKSFYDREGIIISSVFYVKCFINDIKAYNIVVPWRTMSRVIWIHARKFNYLYSFLLCFYMSIHRFYKTIKTLRT